MAVATIVIYLAASMLAGRPILARTLGEWDCGCGDMLIKTTYRVIWNPIRDRRPEVVADEFLADLRAGNCSVDRELCADALLRHRVSDWKLAYREDSGGVVSLYYKLTKYDGAGLTSDLGGVGAIDVRKGSGGLAVAGFSCYF